MSSPTIVNLMTIDVEDYFHANALQPVTGRDKWERQERRVADNTNRLLDLLAESGVKATFFVLGWVAEREPALVRRIAAEGHEVASHSFWHRLVYDMTPEEFREDLNRARGALESQTGKRVRGFRAPSYSIVERSLWALDILIEEGYEYDASIFPIHHDTYGIPSAPRHPYVVTRPAGSLLEVPGATAEVGGLRIPLGGGYFRLFPYAVSRWAIRRMNKVDGQPAPFYLHPWEIDPGQPRFDVSPVTRFRHYNSLGRTEARFARLLQDCRWGTVADTLLPAFPPLADAARVPAVHT
jgi:polysaccharide deacetylase family protein (PEP-CTERM system associated)